MQKQFLLTFTRASFFCALFVFIALLQGCYVQPYPAPPPPVTVAPPAWAPPEAGQCHYYYLPDIEVYYDTWNGEFVYLDGGNWIYSSSLPPAYAGYDLYNQHVVILDNHVHEPWFHHELYVSHYPRYYYHSVYPTDDVNPNHPRGYNENARQPIYNNAPAGSGTSSGGSRGNSPRSPIGQQTPPPARNGSYTPPPRSANSDNQPRGSAAIPNRTNISPAPREAGSPRPPQPVIYNGRSVGQPVRVQRNMQAPQSAPANTSGPRR